MLGLHIPQELSKEIDDVLMLLREKISEKTAAVLR